MAAPLNLVHLGYGFGAVLANLLIRRSGGEPIADRSLSMTNPTSSSSENIKPSYWLTSFLCLIIGVAHLTLAIRQILLRKSEKRERRETEPSGTLAMVLADDADGERPVKLVSSSSPRLCGYGSLSYGLLMSSVWIVYMFFLTGNDQTFSKFFFSFLKTSSLSLTRELATWGMIIYWFSYSVRIPSISLLARSSSPFVRSDRSIDLCGAHSFRSRSSDSVGSLVLWSAPRRALVHLHLVDRSDRSQCVRSGRLHGSDLLSNISSVLWIHQSALDRHTTASGSSSLRWSFGIDVIPEAGWSVALRSTVRSSIFLVGFVRRLAARSESEEFPHVTDCLCSSVHRLLRRGLGSQYGSSTATSPHE